MQKRNIMDFIQSQQRNQIEFFSLEDNIDKQNPVRFIDAFVERMELDKLGFEVNTIKTEGRPGFNSKVFLKLYFYGYLNGIRSSRRLEKECERNIEFQWLMGKLVPNYHSIADFRKDNAKALKNTFKLFVSFLQDAELVEGTTVANDGTKVRAHNSKKNNYSEKKLDRHLKYIEEKTNEYLAQLETNDRQEEIIKVSNVAEKLERLKRHKIKYETLKEELKNSGDTQISTTDKDSRALLVQGQVVEVSYNVQTAVDAKHNLPIAVKTINRNDKNALSEMALEAKQNLGVQELTLLADKGYFNGREIDKCEKNDITTIVATPEMVNSNDKGTTPDYLSSKFIYNKEEDTYTCPQGKTLKTKGTWHRKKKKEHNIYQFKKYRTPECATCPVKHLCTGKARGGRDIERTEFADAVDANNKRYKENQALYRKRQEINEHIFGTIKRQWGYNHTNLTGMEKVNGEMNLIMTVYNMKRALNILGFDGMMEKLKNWKPDYTKATWLFTKVVQLNAIYGIKNNEIKMAA